MKSRSFPFTLALRATSLPGHALRKNPTWNQQTKAASDAQAGGWLINLGITGAKPVQLK